MWRHALLSVKKSLGIGIATEWRVGVACGQTYRGLLTPFSSVASLSEDGDEELRVFIVAGSLLEMSLGAGSWGLCGACLQSPCVLQEVTMEKEGLTSEFKMEDIAVMGAAELFPHMLRMWWRLRQTASAALAFKPHVVVTVDTKGFCFRVLRSLAASYEKKQEQPPFLVHYVAPSYWAWKRGDARLKNLKEFVDHLLCILPFEVPICKAHGVGATFVGHPVLEDVYMNVSSLENNTRRDWEIQGSGTKFRDRHGLQSGRYKSHQCVARSRTQEVKRMLPIFRGAMHRLAEKYPQLTAVIPTARSTVVTNMVQESVVSWEVPVIFLPAASDLEKYDAFSASNAGLCTSGTATMQLLLARVPSVVAYRANLITEWLIRSRTKLKFISLPNILLNSLVVPEALFADCTPERLASLLTEVLEDHKIQELQRRSAEQVFSLLAPPTSSLLHDSGASLTVADELSQKPSTAAARTILELLGQLDSSKHSPIGY